MRVQEIQKTKSGKYRIKLDDQVLVTYDDVILKNSLLYKKEIDVSIYEQMMRDHLYYDAYNKTLSYILKKNRCVKEIEIYLDNFSLNDDDKDKLITHLKEIGLLNEQNYVKAYISDSMYLKNDGPLKIKSHLLELNISDELIDNELDKIDEELIKDKATKIINKKLKSNHKYSEYQLRNKITLEMINLGYAKDLINTILERYNYDDDYFLEKEYQRLYLKLSKKYNGYELSNKIKQKLYSKGFDINKINEIISKKEDEF